jgi:hypothetical protein
MIVGDWAEQCLQSKCFCWSQSQAAGVGLFGMGGELINADVGGGIGQKRMKRIFIYP